MRLAGVKFLRTWNVWPNEASFSAWPVRLAVALSYVPLLILGLVGGVRTLRCGWAYWLCWFPALYFSALHAVFVGSIRYRQPAMLGLIVLAAGVIGMAGRPAHGQRAEAWKRRSQSNGSVLNQGGLSAIVARLINSCWSVFKWGLVLVVDRRCAGGAQFLSSLRREVRRRIETRLAQQYPGLKVTSARPPWSRARGSRSAACRSWSPARKAPRRVAHVRRMFPAVPHRFAGLARGRAGRDAGDDSPPHAANDAPARRDLEHGQALAAAEAEQAAAASDDRKRHDRNLRPPEEPSSTLTLRDVNLTLTPAAGGPARGEPHACKGP